MIGQTVSHYRVLAKLGSGGMGVVYEAEDVRLRRRVALKFLPDGAADTAALYRFRREAETASHLNHPNICTIYDIDEYEGRPFLVMEKIEGETLREAMSGRRLPADRILQIGAEIADALAAAHRAGIIHRDVKPANIFLTSRGEAKLLDFGLARLDSRIDTADDEQTQLTRPGTAVGTIGYMSPEQARGEPLDGRSDIFSLGAVLYELATAQAPFRGASAAVTLDAILNRDPVAPSQLNPDFSERFDHVVLGALEKSPELRVQTAEEMRAQLLRLRRDGSAAVFSTPANRSGRSVERAASQNCPLVVGSRLGRYRIVGILGAGGVGEVYVAQDERLGREVALKVIKGSSSITDRARARFEQEARAASSLNHPNIVTIHDIGEDAGQPFIVMELLNGKTLRELAREPLPLNDLLRIAAQMADALAATHERGIVHRDLKPENVFVTAQGAAKILDFGIARMRAGLEDLPDEHHTREGSAIGTVGYMAPEVINCETADSRADIFSLGCILYEMATGTAPFRGRSANEILAATLRDIPEPVSRRRPDLPPQLARIIERSLEKDRSLRPESTRDLRNELFELSTSVSTPSRERPAAPAIPRADFPMLGREEELALVLDLLSEQKARLVTLSGPGGTGKTRLSIEVIDRLSSHFRGRIFFVPLASIVEKDQVAPAIARALGSVDPTRSALSGAIAELQTTSARTLLVLDNFEHVVAAAPEISELLAGCPSVSILVTSREILHLYGERNVPVPLLSLPESGAESSIEDAMKSPAVMLFAERARAVSPSFTLTADNVSAVVEICRRLDGLPLAIELAAARARLITPQEMLARLEQRFRLLTGGARDLPDRQQTLRRTLDWSHELLSADEQALFRRLSVFVGGFTLDAAEAVADPFGRLGIDVVDGIGSLADKSLLVDRRIEGEEARFAMLETVRDYAAERLDASGEQQAARKAHAAYFLVLAEEEGEAGVTKTNALARFAREHENFRAAIDWLTAAGNTEWGLRLAVAIFPFWERSEHLSEGRKRLDALVALPHSGDELLRARALFTLSVLACAQHDYSTAVKRAEESCDICRRLDDVTGLAVSSNCLGIARRELRDLGRAAESLEESLEYWSRTGDDMSYARSLSNLANVREMQGEFAAAREIYAETEERFKRLGDLASAAWALNHQGDIARAMRQFDEASRLYDTALASFRALGDDWGIASSLVDIGKLARLRGDLDAARAAYREALEGFSRLAHKRGIARVLEALALLAADEAKNEEALTLAGAASRLRELLGAPLPKEERLELDRSLDAARQSLAAADARQPYQCGRCMSIEEAVRYARHRSAT